MTPQQIKDTFYLALRNRIAAANPARTISLRGQLRPAVLVVENEFPHAEASGPIPPDCFTLRWTQLARQPYGLAHLQCEIRYATAGSAAAGGLDRGRSLAAMDAELTAATDTTPQNAQGIFWSGAAFTAVLERGQSLERTATVEVLSYA